jgi:hypothetical protein
LLIDVKETAGNVAYYPDVNWILSTVKVGSALASTVFVEPKTPAVLIVVASLSNCPDWSSNLKYPAT